MRILVVEDDDRVAAALTERLRRHGAIVIRVARGVDAIAHFAPGSAQLPTDIVLLDLGLPDLDGLAVCRAIRRRSNVPIIAVTARTEERDRIAGLRIGADDYVVKPYSTAELLARIEAVLRRSHSALSAPVTPADSPTAGPHQRLALAPLDINLTSREVRRDNIAIPLTRKEFGVLVELVLASGEIVTREQILDKVWGATLFGSTRTLDVHVATLRAKLGDPPLIGTLRGVGYRLLVDARSNGT
jgi:DNA-binding response OmpR family regulator